MNLESKKHFCYTIIRETRGRDVAIGISFFIKREISKNGIKRTVE